MAAGGHSLVILAVLAVVAALLLRRVLWVLHVALLALAALAVLRFVQDPHGAAEAARQTLQAAGGGDAGGLLWRLLEEPLRELEALARLAAGR
jgi:hypothetical protein